MKRHRFPVIAAVCILCPILGSNALAFSKGNVIQVNPDKNSWNVYVHLPENYDALPDKKWPTIIFFNGKGENGYDTNKMMAYGPGAYLERGGWDGKVGNVDFIVMHAQPPSDWISAVIVRKTLDILEAQYRIGELFLTGLSMGGGIALAQIINYPSSVRGVVVLSAVQQSYGGENYMGYLQPFASGGGCLLNFQQANESGNGSSEPAWTMNAIVPGSGWHIKTNYGNGGHNSWNYNYGDKNLPPDSYNINGVTQTIYEWIASNVKLP